MVEQVDEPDAPVDPPKIPTELSALASFIEYDPRPAAILRLLGDLQPGSLIKNAVYHNDAWKRKLSAQVAEDIVTEALAALKFALSGEDGAKDSDLSILHGRRFDSMRWYVRMYKEYCTIIATVKHTDSLARTSENRVLATPSINGTVDEPCIDWTYSSPSAKHSPWVNFILARDWATTRFGHMSTWPFLLRHYAISMMANPNPRLVIWGEHMTFLYNEACVQLFGKAHPYALGRDADEPWSDSWSNLKPLVEKGYRGESTRQDRLSLAIERKGYLEETYWDVTILPIPNKDGHVVGVMIELVETTLLETGERRRDSIATLNDNLTKASTFPELWASVLEGLKACSIDVPFAMLYDVVDDYTEGGIEDSHHKKCVLAGTVGIADTHEDALPTFALLDHVDPGSGIVKACLQAWRTRKSLCISTEEGTLPQTLRCSVPGRGFDEVTTAALISPINSTSGGQVLGMLVLGLNPRATTAPEYKLWLHIMVDFVEKAASLISLPQEQRRAKKIADDMVNSLAHQLRFMTLQAERNELRFARLADNAPQGMFMCDAEGEMLYVNDRYLSMLGETREQHDSRRSERLFWEDRVHEDDLEKFVDFWKKISKEKTPITLEYRLKKPWTSLDNSSGQQISGEFWLLATAFPEIEADGSITAIQGWLTNISHRKFSENLLAQRLKDALENKRQTENFIDMTSHEMRNPLSAILQSADSIVSTLSSNSFASSHNFMALDQDVVEDIVDAAQTIILCAQHQKRIVDDILTLSKLDANLLEISPDKVRLPILVEKALKMYEAELERADIEAQLCIEPTYNDLQVEWILLDPSRLLQVIINLLTNAIKFTRNSEVRKIRICLGASYSKPTGKHHKVSFIPPRPARGSQQAREVQPSASGSGEDIYLQIGVYDTGKGLSVEEMNVLFQRFQQGNSKTYNQYGGSGLGLFISRELCELQGGQIGVASRDGQTVFTFFVKAKRWVPDPSDDSTSMSPRYASTAASPMAYSRRSSIVMKEAFTQLSPTSIGQDGTSEHEFVPLTLKRTISQRTKFSASPPMKTVLEERINEALKTSDQRGLHVLIVEDNIINQKVLSQQLKRAGCIVHVANHGVECLDFLEKSTYCSATTPLSIILLDLEMPIMDGLTCIRQIRQRQKGGQIQGHVPVIAVTANARHEQISTAIEAGMDSVVTKPFRIPELIPQMEKLIKEVSQLAAALLETAVEGS